MLLVIPGGAEAPVTLAVVERSTMSVAEALRTYSGDLPELTVDGFDIPDEQYMALVRRVVEEDIAGGAGSNFVVRRTFLASYRKWSLPHAEALFSRLLRIESGAYWTFVVQWNGRTLAGATPECHVRMRDGRASMNPISGTYRYPPHGPSEHGLRAFLADTKERGELLMVLDEELKMMARVCPGGARVRGPWLRRMSRLAHTEYEIEGPTALPPAEVLRRTMPVPTVTGSPIASARRVIAAREPTDRACYGGVLALVSSAHDMDSALLIRTADIDTHGRVQVAVGATLVRDSDPRAEAAETHAKAAAVLTALRNPAPVRQRLADRNAGLSTFWLGEHCGPATPTGAELVIVDAEDDFTAMLARMAESLGHAVHVIPWHDYQPDSATPVLLGPGPGDPRNLDDQRIRRLRAIAGQLLAARTPLLGVCLGHQVLAAELGLTVTRLGEPAQGVRRTIMLDGRPERVGFYHSYTALSGYDHVDSPVVAGRVQVIRDPTSGQVHALNGPGIRSVQFHMESVLTERGPALLHAMLTGALARYVDKVQPTVQ